MINTLDFHALIDHLKPIAGFYDMGCMHEYLKRIAPEECRNGDVEKAAAILEGLGYTGVWFKKDFKNQGDILWRFK